MQRGHVAQHGVRAQGWPSNWVIEYTEFDSFDSVTTTPVAPTDGLQHDPDIACTDDQLFVSWFEKEGSGDRLFVSHAERNGSPFVAPRDLGFDGETQFFSGLVLAGVANTAYAAFRRTSGDLRFKSWTVGAGPNHPVTANPRSSSDPVRRTTQRSSP